MKNINKDRLSETWECAQVFVTMLGYSILVGACVGAAFGTAVIVAKIVIP